MCIPSCFMCIPSSKVLVSKKFYDILDCLSYTSIESIDMVSFPLFQLYVSNVLSYFENTREAGILEFCGPVIQLQRAIYLCPTRDDLVERVRECYSSVRPRIALDPKEEEKDSRVSPLFFNR